MKSIRRSKRVKVSATGTGLVSRSGVALLRELTEMTGLVQGWTEQLLDTYKAIPTVHAPGRVLADLAVTIADGGDALSHLATLRDQDKLFSVVASAPTAWRVIDRVDTEHLARLRAVRAEAQERAWAAGAGPDLSAGLTIDLDATILISHSEKQNAARDLEEDLRVSPADGNHSGRPIALRHRGWAAERPYGSAVAGCQAVSVNSSRSTSMACWPCLRPVDR